MSDVVIFGVGDFARIAAVYLRDDSPHDVVAFAVDDEYATGESVMGIPVVAASELSTRHPPGEAEVLVAVGFSRVNRARTEVYARCKSMGYGFITYVHSSVPQWPETTIGENCFIFEENVIQPFVSIGDNVVLWSGNHVGHDVTIGSHCFIASHAVISGNCHIGDSCFVGVNATFRDGVTVAPRCVIGAGALIMRDTEEGGVYSVPGTKPIDRKSWELKGF